MGIKKHKTSAIQTQKRLQISQLNL